MLDSGLDLESAIEILKFFQVSDEPIKYGSEKVDSELSVSQEFNDISTQEKED